METTAAVQTLTDELLGEIEKQGFTFGSTLEHLAREIRTLRAENAELRKDAGRYRALRHSLSGKARCSHTQMPCVSDPISPFRTYTPDGFDAAIDSVMEQAK